MRNLYILPLFNRNTNDCGKCHGKKLAFNNVTYLRFSTIQIFFLQQLFLEQCLNCLIVPFARYLLHIFWSKYKNLKKIGISRTFFYQTEWCHKILVDEWTFIKLASHFLVQSQLFNKSFIWTKYEIVIKILGSSKLKLIFNV